MTLDWIKVDSAVMTKYRYDPNNFELLINFTAGDIWKYSPVTPELFRRFQVAQSKGRFFRAFIRNDKNIRSERASTPSSFGALTDEVVEKNLLKKPSKKDTEKNLEISSRNFHQIRRSEMK